MKNLSNLKFVVMAMFVALLSLSLTACSDDDDDKGGNDDKKVSSIVGTWKYTETGADWSETTTLTVNSDGTYIQSLKGIVNGNEYSGTERGTYTIEGNKIYATNEYGRTTVYTYRLSGNTLTLSYIDEKDDERVVLSFKKV